MKKKPAIAVMTVALIFAASKINLMPIYAAVLPAPAGSIDATGDKVHGSLLAYLRSSQEPIQKSIQDLIDADDSPSGKVAAPGQKETISAATLGPQVYQEHCAICHGEQREGILPAFPPLVALNRRLDVQQVESIVHQGKGRMPGFPKIQRDELTSLLHFLDSAEILPTTATSGANESQLGGPLYQQNCAFCHGRDAAGGETGPDLTRSKLVEEDRAGDKIAEVIRNGRLEKKMPAFKFSDAETAGLVAFIHYQTKKAASAPGGRRGVDVEDLQTGDVSAGKQYFQGLGGCSSCHSPTGDLAHVATRYQGLQLEERMLYPRDVKSKVTVTLPSGEIATGIVAFQDEFVIGLIEAGGRYRSWPVTAVKYAVKSPVDAHVVQFGKYTDADIHNLMAYLQTLR